MPIRVYHNPDFLTFYREPDPQAIDLAHLYLAAIVASDDPETAYRLTQHVETWYENPGVTTVVRSRSTSVGDVLTLADGRLLVVASFGFEPLVDAALPADGSALMRRLVAAISALAGDDNQEAADALEASAGQVRALSTALLFALPLLEAVASSEKVKPYQALLARFAAEQARGALAQADGEASTMATQLALAYAQKERLRRPRRRICDLPPSEQPLYRLQQHGSAALSNAELLALVLGSADGLELGQELLVLFGSLSQLARASRGVLLRVRGIGPAQAARLAAVLELSRRLQLPDGEEPARITCPTDAVALLAPAMAALDQEELRVMLLDTRNRVIATRTIYKGSLNTSVMRVGEIFRPAVEAPAAAIIVCHNHPSTDPSPSPEDVYVTRQITQAGKLLDIEVLDHLIVAAGGRYVSLKERNLGFD